MEEKLITIKDVPLKNNCPECYSNEGLVLTFKQKFKETKFYKSISNETVTELSCKKCGTDIYPVSWTDDIERVYEYQRKAFTPKPSSLKLKRLAWIIFIAIDLVIIAIILASVFPEAIVLN